jgi:hypothetical protein
MLTHRSNWFANISVILILLLALLGFPALPARAGALNLPALVDGSAAVLASTSGLPSMTCASFSGLALGECQLLASRYKTNRPVLANENYITLAYTLGISKTGNGAGTVTSSPAGIACGSTCSAAFANGQLISLTPAANPNSSFTGWSGGICQGSGVCTFLLVGPTTVTAEFTLNKFPLSVNVTGAGDGYVTSITTSPGAIFCGPFCSASFYYGISVTLLASPLANSIFTGWSGAGCSGTGTCTLTIWKYTLVEANFSQALSYTLTVRKSGTGVGEVTSSPTGIVCGPACFSAFSDNMIVTLASSPSPGSFFTGWSGGGCSGRAACILNMDAAKSVEAMFDLATDRIYLPLVLR